MNLSSTARTTYSPWLWIPLIAVLFALGSWSQLPAAAQDKKAPAAKTAEKDTEEAVEEGEGEDKEAGATEGEEQAEKEPEQKNALWWLIETSGWIGGVLLVLSIYFVATVIRLFLEFRQQVAMPPEVVAQVEQCLEARDFMGVYKAVKENDSFYSNVLRESIPEMQVGLAEAREAMERSGEVETVDMERQISMLAVLGSLGPMIGLLGTLKGMIASFSVIALSDTQLKASEVAGGISEALVLTFEGVGLSVPAIFFFAYFRNRLTMIAATTLLSTDEVLRRIAAAARKKPVSTEV